MTSLAEACGELATWLPERERAHDRGLEPLYEWQSRAVLAAAAPLIAAAAWRAGYGQGRDDEASGLPLREGPPWFEMDQP